MYSIGRKWEIRSVSPKTVSLLCWNLVCISVLFSKKRDKGIGAGQVFKVLTVDIFWTLASELGFRLHFDMEHIYI